MAIFLINYLKDNVQRSKTVILIYHACEILDQRPVFMEVKQIILLNLVL